MIGKLTYFSTSGIGGQARVIAVIYSIISSWTMARKLRLYVSRGVYQVMVRGNGGSMRLRFVGILERSIPPGGRGRGRYLD
jgi:hypothetical protein